jgi:hypothetical protein
MQLAPSAATASEGRLQDLDLPFLVLVTPTIHYLFSYFFSSHRNMVPPLCCLACEPVGALIKSDCESKFYLPDIRSVNVLTPLGAPRARRVRLGAGFQVVGRPGR